MTITANAQQVTPKPATKAISRHLTTVARVAMGIIFTVMGLNGFLNFLPQPTTPMPDGAVKFSLALAESGYLMQLTMGVQVIVGVLLLVNRFVPLALVLLAPVVVNIFAFHLFLAPDGLPVAIVVAALEIALAWANRDAFRSVLRATRR
jgi:uncharacterized membrane protein YphA (DoxX/SURF4 family)